MIVIVYIKIMMYQRAILKAVWLMLASTTRSPPLLVVAL